MADPRFYVRPCPPQYLGKYGAKVGRQTGQSRDFFTAANEIGNLEVLNDIGAGSIGKGLRVLAGISDTVRTGCGNLPTSLGGAIGGILDDISSAATSGIDWVLQNMGLNTSVIDAVRAFNPDVANIAYGQAKVIYDRIKSGEFSFEQIPSFLQDFINLERLMSQIYTPAGNQQLQARCEASPYAVDLIRRHGKYQFLFVVEFVFNPGYNELSQLTFPFVIKRSTRPNVRFQMEDVNYYNFRTKAVTKTDFEDMSMTFHDDQLNQSMRFYNAYMRAYSPITNIGSAIEMMNPEERGMDFVNSAAALNLYGAGKGTAGQIVPNYYTGTYGPLAEDEKGVLSYINIYHVYDNGNTMNIITFFNPRISQLQLNDLDMVGSELNEFSCVFNYDSIHVQTDVQLDAQNSAAIEQQLANPVYPLRYNDSARSVQGPNNAGIAPQGGVIGVADQCDPEIDTSLPSIVSPPFIQAGIDTALDALSNISF